MANEKRKRTNEELWDLYSHILALAEIGEEPELPAEPDERAMIKRLSERAKAIVEHRRHERRNG